MIVRSSAIPQGGFNRRPTDTRGEPAGDLFERLHLVGPLHVDPPHPRSDRAQQVGVGLGGAGGQDPRRRKPARRAASSSPREATSAPSPISGQEREHGERGVGLHRVGQLEGLGQGGGEACHLPLDPVEIVDVERRAEARCRAREERRRSAPLSDARAGGRVPPPHLSATRSRGPSLRPSASRYFTIIGAERDSPCCFAHSPGAGRVPGTTTAPSGIVSGRSGLPRSSARSRGRRRRSTTSGSSPAARTARRRTQTPSYSPRPRPRRRRPRRRPGRRSDRLEHAAHLRRGRQVDALSDLRARADERVAVDHRALVDVGPDVDVRRGHDDDALRDVRAAPDGRASRDDADPRRQLAARRQRVAVAEEKRAGLARLLDAEAEGREDSLLHGPGSPPSPVRVRLAARSSPRSRASRSAMTSSRVTPLRRGSIGCPAASRRPAA